EYWYKFNFWIIANNNFFRLQLYIRKFLIATIREAKKMRPNASWGFYGMPFCNYSAGKSDSAGCGRVYKKFNDRIAPLYTEVDAFYPSIYLPHRGSNITSYLYVTSVLQEAERCAKKVNPKMPIFAYTGIEYFPLNFSNPFYSKKDLHNSLSQAYHMGLQGAIIWSTSKNMMERCDGIKNYVVRYLGPEIANLANITSPKTASKN
ncbi:unnamed protein product, partial [Onchocerca flexuosa]|uniref:Hyaluronidase n=1 Tax=Onchocerca flexuosa TaxID=387005 RepID=A0A183HQ14_9BILA